MNSKQESRLAKSLMGSVVKSLFSAGVLTNEDLSLSEEEFFDKIKNIINRIELGIVVDHRGGIITQANTFYNLKKYEYSKIFFAMFFEHSLNGIIEQECKRREIDDKTKTDIIRSIDMFGKLTWLLKIFGYRVFNKNHANTIKKLSDDRNAFIHYKWKPEPDESVHLSDSKIDDEFKKIKSAVKYMKMYESHVLFQKNKKKIVAKLKR